MMWAYDIEVDGAKLDIEYEAGKDDEGRAYVEIGQVLAGGVNIGPLLYTLGELAADEMLADAVRKYLAEDAGWHEVFGSEA